MRAGRFSSAAGLMFLLLAALPLLAQDDPRRDGWQTESFSLDATEVLNALPLFDNLPRAQVEAIFNQPFEGQFSRRAASLFDEGQFQVHRFGTTHETFDSPETFLANLRDTFADSSQQHTKYKIVRVSEKSGTVETVALVAIHGLTPAGRFESNQTWQIDWISEPLGSNPKISAIHILKREDSFASTTQGQPLFVEKTASVFRDESLFRDQLMYGQAYWQRRIESFHGILNPGQNGISVGDVNGDGLDDIYVCQPGGLPNRLLLHRPDGTVDDVSAFSQTNILDNSHASLIVDFDNDGDQDLLVSSATSLLMFSNFGNNQFRLMQRLDWVPDAYSLASCDFDADGDLDVYACSYFPQGADVSGLPVPVPYFDAKNGGRNFLIENQGGWKVNDATVKARLDANNHRFSYACLWIDFDNDGDHDLYVANDFGPDNLYRNDRDQDNVTFTEVSQQIGIRMGAFGMSVDAADVDHDGYEDLYIANMFSSAGNRITRQMRFRPNATAEKRLSFQNLAAGNTLFLNREGVKLDDVASTAGVTMGRWSWGSNFVDINNDGWEDLVVANGYITGDDPSDL